MSLQEVMDLCKALSMRVSVKAHLLEAQMPRKQDAAWTLAVKATLEEIGSQKGYESLYSNRGEEKHEFLLDLVWWDRHDGLEAAALACECELGNKRNESGNPQLVAEDFDKLLSFKAPLKLMIFDSYGTCAKSKTTMDDVVAALNGYLRRYRLHTQGETYILWDCSDVPRFWKCDIKLGGSDQSLAFQNFELD
jgi:hypothetical protein